VGPLVIVEAAEGGERPLLQRQRGPRGPDRFAFEHLVHPLVGPVLLRVHREDPLVLNPQAEPPHVELGEPVNPGRGKGHPVVRADRPGQPVLAKELLDDQAHPSSRFQ